MENDKLLVLTDSDINTEHYATVNMLVDGDQYTPERAIQLIEIHLGHTISVKQANAIYKKVLKQRDKNIKDGRHPNAIIYTPN